MVTLLSVYIIGLALASYLWLVSHQNLSTMRSLAWNSTLPVMEVGVEEALTQLQCGRITNSWVNGWTTAPSGWYYKKNFVNGTDYYEVNVQKVDPPIIVSTGCVPAPLGRYSQLGLILAQVVPPNSTPEVKRRVRVNTRRRAFASGAMVAKGHIYLAGNNVTTDGFDSGDDNYSTNGKWDPGKTKASGDVASNSRDPDAINVGAGDITGHVATGPGGGVIVGSGGTVGDIPWVKAITPGIKPGWSSADMNMDIPDVKPPFDASTVLGVPIAGIVNHIKYTSVFDGTVFPNYKVGTLTGQVYVTGNVTLLVTDLVSISSGDYIKLAPGATLKLYVSAPTAAIGGSGVVNYDGYAANFQYYGLPTNTSFDFRANASYTGSIYAPQANFTLGGGGNDPYDFVGACTVNTVKMNGHYHFHFDEALRKTPWQGYLVTAWNEMNPYAPIQ